MEEICKPMRTLVHLDHHDRPGWHYEITPMTFGKARICLTDGIGVENGW